jgi:hypothetical protein
LTESKIHVLSGDLRDLVSDFIKNDLALEKSTHTGLDCGPAGNV